MADDPPQAEAPSSHRRGWLPVWLHLIISIIILLIGFLASLAVTAVVNHHFRLSGQGLPGIAVMIAAFVVGTGLPMLIMMKCVPVRCSACGGRCWGRNSKRPNE